MQHVPDIVEVVWVLVTIKHRKFQQPPCRALGLVKKLLKVLHSIVCKVDAKEALCKMLITTLGCDRFFFLYFKLSIIHY